MKYETLTFDAFLRTTGSMFFVGIIAKASGTVKALVFFKLTLVLLSC